MAALRIVCYVVEMECDLMSMYMLCWHEGVFACLSERLRAS